MGAGRPRPAGVRPAADRGCAASIRCSAGRTSSAAARSPGTAVKDIVWLNPEGREQRDDDWHFPEARCLGFFLGGDAGELFYSTGGRQELDDGFVVLMNAFHEAGAVHPAAGRTWAAAGRSLLDTARDAAAGEQYDAGGKYQLEPRSLVVLIRRGPLQSAVHTDPQQLAAGAEAQPLVTTEQVEAPPTEAAA